MVGRLRRFAWELPRTLRLAYCLFFDPRVPATHKAAVGAALGLIVTPFIDLPGWLPVVGEMDVLALSVMAMRVFINTAPSHLVAEHESLLRQHRSRFDRDVEEGRRLAVLIASRVRAASDAAGHGEEGPGHGRAAVRVIDSPAAGDGPASGATA